MSFLAYSMHARQLTGEIGEAPRWRCVPAGIPAENLSRLFQPFFTTMDIGKGTGLGLYRSRDIVAHRHNGCIDVRSVPGETRVRVRLPLSDSSGDPRRRPSS